MQQNRLTTFGVGAATGFWLKNAVGASDGVYIWVRKKAGTGIPGVRSRYLIQRTPQCWTREWAKRKLKNELNVPTAGGEIRLLTRLAETQFATAEGWNQSEPRNVEGGTCERSNPIGQGEIDGPIKRRGLSRSSRHEAVLSSQLESSGLFYNVANSWERQLLRTTSVSRSRCNVGLWLENRLDSSKLFWFFFRGHSILNRTGSFESSC